MGGTRLATVVSELPGDSIRTRDPSASYDRSPAIERSVRCQLLSRNGAGADLSYKDLPFKRPGIKYDSDRGSVPHKENLELRKPGNMGSCACPGGIRERRVLQRVQDCLRRALPMWQVVDNGTSENVKGNKGKGYFWLQRGQGM